MAQCSSAGGETRGGRRRTEEEAGDKRDRSKQAQIRRPKISCDEDQLITRAKDSFCDKKRRTGGSARTVERACRCARAWAANGPIPHGGPIFFWGGGSAGGCAPPGSIYSLPYRKLELASFEAFYRARGGRRYGRRGKPIWADFGLNLAMGPKRSLLTSACSTFLV